jgi:predicted dinucleotide-binding enzyme
MTHVTIIGSGNMGQAISGLVSKGGNTVELLRHSDTGKPVTGDIVVLAVPHAAIPDILATRGDQLVGKVVVDITNPLNFQTFDSLTVPADSSAAAQIAASLPQSRVVTTRAAVEDVLAARTEQRRNSAAATS